MLLDPPRALPTGGLSISSLRLYLQCPERWRRRYIEGEWEPIGGAAVVGAAVDAAESTNYRQKIDTGLDLPVSDVLDEYGDRFDFEAASDRIAWGDDRPGKVKDSGVDVLRLYHRIVAPRTHPVAVQLKLEVELPGVDWTFTGYPDLEDEGGTVDDVKVRSAHKGVVKQAEAEADIQPTGYLFGRRATAEAASGFRYHSLVRVQKPEPKHVALTTTTRSDGQLDSFQDLLYKVATEIDWRLETDVWTGAVPGSWWCSERYCGFWGDCPYGGKWRSPVALPQAVASA